MPALPDNTDPSTDSQTPVWGLHSDLLTRAVQLKGLYYNDDARYGNEVKELLDEITAAKMNKFDVEGGNNKLKLGKNFRRRY